MGWTSYHADFYKGGKIDRLAEVENVLNGENEHGIWRVLKSSLVGKTIYSAVDFTNKTTGENIVFATVFLTSVDANDFYNFSYKDMDETCGPCECDCPKSILALLTPTENEFAQEWRKRCYENLEKKKLKKQNPDSLSNLPVGSKISATWGAGVIILIKIKHGYYKNPVWVNEDITCRYKISDIERNGYIVLRGEQVA